MSDPATPRHGLEALCSDAAAGSAAGIEIRVLADSGFINLRLDPQRQHLMSAVADVLGHALPTEPNTVSGDDSRCYSLGPDEWLIVADASRAQALSASLNGALENEHVAINDLSGGYVRFRLAGERVRDVLAKGTTIDLHPLEFRPGQCAQTGLARASVLIGPVGEAGIMELIVRRSFSDYLFRWLDHSRH